MNGRRNRDDSTCGGTSHRVKVRIFPARQRDAGSPFAGPKSLIWVSKMLAVYLVLASIIGATTAHVFHSHSLPQTHVRSQAASLRQNPPKYLVLMVLDGARPDYLGLTKLPHLDALEARGTRFTHAFDGILEAETPAGHATISTGSRPDRSGILGFDWGTDNSRYSLFSPSKMGALEQILQRTHVPTLAGLYKAKHPRAKVVALSGHKYYAAAPLGGPDADAIMFYQGDSKGRYVPVAIPGHVPPASVLHTPGLIAPTIHLPVGAEDNLATKLALAARKKMHPRLLLINYPEFDWPLGHVYGGILDRSRVIADMKGFDSDLGEIENAYRKNHILSKTMFVITADHGMMPITHFVPSSIVTNAVAAAGTSAPDIASNSGDYIWLANPAKAETVADNILTARDPGIQSAYYLTAVDGKPAYEAARGIALGSVTESTNQFLLGALLNGHEPSVVVFGNEGASFSDPASHWKADHGGNSWQSQHIPLVMSGPGVKRGVTRTAPVQLDDVAPTVLANMGVAPVGMEGHVLTDALKDVASQEKHARAAEIKRLRPMVTSLLAHDRKLAG